MAVHVRVDQAGMDEQPGGVQHLRPLRRTQPRRTDVGDHAVPHQDVGRFGAAPGRIGEQRAADQQRALADGGHRSVSGCGAQVAGWDGVAQGNSRRSAKATIWNSTMPMAASTTTAPNASGTLKNAIDVWIR